MASIFRSDKGITLVEILAAIVIVSFLTIIIWRFFFQTIDYNSYAVTEQSLQQEANVILATLQAEHTRNTIHVLYLKNNGLYAKVGDSCTEISISSKPGIVYILPDAVNRTVTSPCSFSGSALFSTSADNRINMPVKINLSSTYKDGQTIDYLLNTQISKLTAN